MPGVLDENVVILKFDNSDFEKNTKQSMETLQQMKQSFKDSDSGEQLEKLGKAAKNVDLSGLEQGVERLNKRFSLFGTIGTQAINNLTNYAMSSTKRILTAVPNQIIQGGWKRAMNIEQAKFQIEGLKMAWDETSDAYVKGAQTIKQNVLDAVNGTAFGLDEAAKVAAQFGASGMKAGEDMTNALKGISGVAAMSGSSFEDIGRIFTQVSGQGRLMGDQLLQLSGRGINAAATLAKQMGKTEAEVREMVSKGQIDFKTFAEAMNNAFGEHAKKANDTYTGSLANMKAALSRIGADVESKKLENMRHIFNALTPVIDQIHVLLGGVIERINSMSTAVSNFAVKGLNSIEFALKPFVDTIKGEKTALSFVQEGTKVYEHAYQKLSKKQKEATDGMTATSKQAKIAWEIINGGFSDDPKERKAEIHALGEKYAYVQRYTNALIKAGLDEEECHIKVEGAAKKASKATSQYGLSTEKAAANLGKMAPMVKIIAGLANVVNAAKAGFNGLKSILTVVGTEAKKMLEPIVGSASTRFFTFTKKLASKAKEFEGFGKALTKSGDGMRKYVASMGFSKDSKFYQNVVSFRSQIKGFASDAQKHAKTIVKFFDELRDRTSRSEKIKSMVDSLKKLKSAIAELAANKLGVVRQEFNKLFGIFKEKATLDNAIAGIENFATKITNFIKGLTDGEAHLTKFVNMFTSLEGKITGLGALNFNFGADSANFKSLKNGAMGAVVKAADMIQKAGVPEKFGKATKGLQSLTNAAVESGKKFDAKSALKGIFGFFKSLDYNKIADFGLKVSGIVSMFRVVKQLGDVTNATVGMMGSISGFFKSLSGLAGTVKKQLKVETFRTIAMSVAMLVGSVAILALIPKDRLGVAMGCVIAIMGFLTGIVALAQSKAFDANKMRVLGVSFAGMGAAMLSLAVAAEKISKIPAEGLAKAGITITAFIGMFVLAGHVAKEIQASGKSFLAMAAAINALLFALNALAVMPWDTIVKGGTAILYLMTELALASKIAGKSKPGGFLSMAMAIDLLIPAIIVMSMLPADKALKGAAIISGVMYAIAGAAFIVGQSKSNFKSMVAMSTVIATTAASLTVLSLLDPAQLMVGALALVSTLTTIAIASDIAAQAAKGAIAIAGVVALLTAAIVVLVKLDINKSLAATASLSTLALSLAAALSIFSGLGIQGALMGLAGLSIAITGLISLMALLGHLNKLTKGVAVEGIKSFGDILEAIGEAFGRFTGGFISGMSSGLPNAAQNLSDFMTKIQPFLDMAKSIKGGSLKGVKNLSDVLMNLSQIDFSQIAKTGKLDAFGDALQQMAAQFIVFSTTLSMIPKDSIKKTNNVAEIMKTFTEVANAIPAEGGFLQKKITGTKSISDFAQQIASASLKLSSTLKAMEGMEITDGDLEKISKIGDIISTLSKAASKIPPSEGVIQGLAGNTTINEFAEYLASFAPSFSDFQANLISMPEIDEGQMNKIDQICNVISTMVKAANKIPPSEGVKQFFTGNTTINEFANQMALMIPGLYTFLSALAKFPDELMAAVTKVPAIGLAISAMAKAAEVIPTVGGLKGLVGGFKSLGVFAADLAAFMPNFITFLTGISAVKISKGDVKKMQRIGDGLKAIAELSNTLKRSGGLKGKLFGDKDLGKFSEGLEKLADGVKKAVKKFGDVKTKNLATTMSNVKKAVGKAASFDKAPSAAKLNTLASNVKSFASKLNKTKTGNLIDKSSDVAKAVSKLASAAADGVKGSDFKKFSKAGKEASEQFVKGVKKGKKGAKKGGKAVGDDAEDGMKSGAKGAYKIGENVGEGFVKGVRSKIQAAYKAGYDLGKASIKGKKDATRQNSPSKEAMKVGEGVGEGFVMGIDSYRKKVYNAGYGLGKEALNAQMEGIEQSINDISSPVITPVLDSSNIDRAIKSLNGKFTTKAALGINPVQTNPVDKIVASLSNSTQPSNNITNTFNVSVDGTENPEVFANRFVNQLRMQMRTV